jgi:hypothetical protein
MEQDNVIAMPPQSNDWSKLMRKLRWIGMEEEALRLQRAVLSLPFEERGTVSAWPFSTD